MGVRQSRGQQVRTIQTGSMRQTNVRLWQKMHKYDLQRGARVLLNNLIPKIPMPPRRMAKVEAEYSQHKAQVLATIRFRHF